MPSSRFMLVLLLPLLLMGPVRAGIAPSNEALHPQDGPHVDVRIFITDEEVRVRLETRVRVAPPDR